MKKITPVVAIVLAFGAALLGADPAEAHGNEKHASVPAASALDAIASRLDSVDKAIAQGDLSVIHGHAEAIQTAVDGLHPDAGWDPAKTRRVQGYTNNILKLTDKLHDAADAKDLAGVKRADKNLKAQFDLLKKQFAKLAENQTSKQAGSAAPAGSAKPIFAATDAFRAGLGDVHEGYQGIRTALVKDDFNGAQQAFNAMHGKLHMLPTDDLRDPALTYWNKRDSELMDILHSMASSKDTREMRKYFAEFSPMLKDVFDRFGVRTKGPFSLSR